MTTTAADSNQAATDKPYDQMGQIIAYESGELDELETVELFQHLVDSGLAWQLQGHYGRTAKALIDSGYVTLPTDRVNRDYYGNVITKAGA